jgi:hypothetical protein
MKASGNVDPVAITFMTNRSPVRSVRSTVFCPPSFNASTTVTFSAAAAASISC